MEHAKQTEVLPNPKHSSNYHQMTAASARAYPTLGSGAGREKGFEAEDNVVWVKTSMVFDDRTLVGGSIIKVLMSLPSLNLCKLPFNIITWLSNG